MEWCPPLHLGVVAIEKGAFGSPSSKVANFTYFLLYLFIILIIIIIIFLLMSFSYHY